MTTSACGSASTSRMSKNLSQCMCSAISPKATGSGSKRCATSLRTMPCFWSKARTRRSRTGSTSPWKPKVSAATKKSPAPSDNVSNETEIMGFKCGIVGLPNVGKSTLFNALTQTAAAQAANYPFCTIEPNVVEIAGLVRGASKGEGLGNQFLATIREVDAIVHVVRCFVDSDVTHVEGKIDPIADIDTIETELMLADLDSLEKRVDNLEKKAKGTGEEAKQAKELLDLVKRSLVLLREGKPARMVNRTPDEERIFHSLGLLTSAPVLYACNV